MNILSATPRVAPDLLKVLAFPSDITVRKSSVDQEDLKQNWNVRKKGHTSLCDRQAYDFSNALLTKERNLTGRQSSAVGLSSTFLDKGTTDETFQPFEKQDSFRHILKAVKSSASLYESSGLKYCRNFTKIQSGPDDFEESSFIISYRNIVQFQIRSRSLNR